MPRTKGDTKRIALYLTNDAIELLGRLAPSENKRGQYVSGLIRTAAEQAGLIETPPQPPTVAEQIAAMKRQLAELEARVQQEDSP